MESAISYVALGISMVSLTISVVGTVLLRREPPDVAEMKARVMAVDQEVTDVNDRLTQWMRRESVRKMQEAKAARQTVPAQVASSVKDRKAALRAQLFGNAAGGES